MRRVTDYVIPAETLQKPLRRVTYFDSASASSAHRQFGLEHFGDESAKDRFLEADDF